MKFKKSFFGYNKKDVDDKLDSSERLIELQRRDIEYLKKDNEILRNLLDGLSDTNK